MIEREINNDRKRKKESKSEAIRREGESEIE